MFTLSLTRGTEDQNKFRWHMLSLQYDELNSCRAVLLVFNIDITSVLVYPAGLLMRTGVNP